MICMMRREIVYFREVEQEDGTKKLQGNISNGKIIFPDKDTTKKVKPKNYYDCLIHETSNTAFARDIKYWKL